ncbi:tail fiber domain-containing protein [bacterium]|nr:tail fiber domain-containing protein [bacterium]
MDKRLVIGACAGLILIAGLAAGTIPQLINYQGVLNDSEGNPVNGNQTIEFLLYDVETEGIAVWSETQEVIVTDGLFNVLLGYVEPIPYPVFDSTFVYLALKVGADEEMTPRQRLVSVGYAFRANRADSLGNSGAADYLRTISGVAPGNGNIDLVEGSNITITPDDAANTITIAASGGSAPDNLGNHTANQNIRLNGNWLSNDGSNTGISIGNGGHVGIAKEPDPSLTYKLDVKGGIRNNSMIHTNAIATNTLTVNMEMLAQGNIRTNNGSIKTGSPSFTGYGVGDIVADDDLIADDDLVVVDHAVINGTTINGTYALYVTGSAYFTGTWQSSDIKYKDHIQNVESQIDQVKRLRGVNFSWKTGEFPEMGFQEGRQYGLIAQEVEEVFPELVREDENGDKAVNYIGMIPILLETIKGQQKAIERLESRINQLVQ